MAATYVIQSFQVDRADRVAALRAAVADELSAVGLQRSIEIVVTENGAEATTDTPSVGVCFGSAEAIQSGSLTTRLETAIAEGLVVIPVVDDLARFGEDVPSPLARFNGHEWGGPDPAVRLARLLLEELGIEERQRRVFISHKREDGLGAAEQLHDELTHRGFVPFIDRFAIRSGMPVQPAIANALEDFAFLLLLETPLAHESAWVFDEVDYALSHTMGTLILTWPGGVSPVPGSIGLPRLELTPRDLVEDEHGYEVFTHGSMDRVVDEVEAAHARGLVRRRRMLVNSVEEAAHASGCSSCIPLRGWRLQVEHEALSTLVGVAPRLPDATDLQSLDEARTKFDPECAAVLVHSARVLPETRRDHLRWVVGTRELSLTPENAIGAHWNAADV